MHQDRLERQVATAFQMALASGRLDVADHLADALQTICPDPLPGSSLATAYLAISKKERTDG